MKIIIPLFISCAFIFIVYTGSKQSQRQQQQIESLQNQVDSLDGILNTIYEYDQRSQIGSLFNL